MSFTTWVKVFWSPRGKVLALYRSGMAKAKRHDYRGAITDYSEALRAPHLPTDVKAMVIYNRALAYFAIHEVARATEDLAAVLEMPGLPTQIKIHAQDRWKRIQPRQERGKDPMAHPQIESS
jgi:hypothetical protein